MPFAYLTFLKPPPILNPGAGKCADSDCVSPVQLEPPSSRGPRSGHVPAESSESELEVVSPEGPRAGGHPAGTYEAQLRDDRPSSWSKSGRRGDSQIRHNNRSGEVVENVAPHAESRGPEPESSLNPADSANRGLVVQEHDSENRRPASGEKERNAKRAKHQKRHSSLRQRLRPAPVTGQTGDIGRPSPTSRSIQETAPTLSPTPERPTTEAYVEQSGGDHSQLVSTWMNDPEILRVSQTPALARHRQPRQELLSYLDLIASIGTADVVRSFAVGVTHLMCHARFSYEVPSAPSHLLNIEDADAMQCFWRAAYRSQVNASLVSFGVILHRRSLATLRYCYFKAIKSIKSTMQRKGLPGHTKSAIARGILLDTVFPGSDKLVGVLLHFSQPVTDVEQELKRMSDRLKNDVTRARNYCRLIEYYGSSGILGLLPRSLTDTRMRDLTDAEFGIFLSLITQLRPDLEAERTTATEVESGTFSRMRIWGRMIDMTQAGLRPLKDDHDFVQKDTGILLPQVENMSESVHSQVREAGQIMVGTAANTVSRHMGQDDFDTCGPPLVLDSDGRVQEVSE